MPKIALFSCIIFILYLFIIDIRNKPAVSSALWIPLIWIGLVGSRVATQWLAIGKSTSELEVTTAMVGDVSEGSPFDAAVFLLLIVAGIITLASRKINWQATLKTNKWIFLFYLYIGISTLWSFDTFISFKRWVKDFGNLVMVLIVLSEINYVVAIKTLFRRLMYALIPLSVVFIKYYPNIGRTFSRSGVAQYTGVTLHKNSLGALCIVVMIMLIWQFVHQLKKRTTVTEKRERIVSILFIFMIVYILNMADSATAVMGCIIGVAILIGVQFPIIKKNLKYIGAYVILIVILSLTLQYLFNIKELVISDLGRDETLTGRTIIWEEALAFAGNPIIGAGYEGFWTGDRASYFLEKYWWHPNQSHNGYLETYLSVGSIGLFIICMVILSAYKRITNNMPHDFEFQKLRLALLVVALLVNVTESAFKGLSLTWIVFLLITTESPMLLNVRIANKN